MQQGQTYILIVGFPDLNYGIKAVNQNKLLLLIDISSSAPFSVARRSLLFTSVGPNAVLDIPNRRQFSIDFKNKVNINI